VRPISIFHLGLILVAILSAQATKAQQLQVDAGKGPHYVGTFIEIQVTATQFPGDPAPQLEVSDPTSGRLDFVDFQPSTNQSITIVNGRMTRKSEVRAVYRYRFVAEAPGRVTIGPFTLSQGGMKRQSRPLHLQIRTLELSKRLRVELKLPEGPIFVGQRVPISVEFWLESKLQENLHNYILQVPLFDQTKSFRFTDGPPAPGGTDVRIETAQGQLGLSGTAREVTRDGTNFLVVTVLRTMIPSRSGKFEIPRTSLVVDEATRWQRDFFGGRRATHVQKLRAVDLARSIEVAAVPSANRPESFAGAVGRGYSLEVSADRSVVQVGDPITLTFSLRGEGNLLSAGLPPLSAKGLLDPEKFRVPVGELAGKLKGDTKRFSAVVRVESSDVREIPALDYTWFDADTRSFQTTSSRPIALSVRAAKLVGADDVVRSEAPAETGSPLAPETSFQEPDTVVALTGADLAIEQDVATLARGSSSGETSGALLAACYLVPSLLFGLSLLDRKRRAVDPALLRVRKSLDSQRKRIIAAASLSGRDQAREYADALREMIALLPDSRSPELESFLGECDALIYAPQGTEARSDEPLGDRALQHTESILEQAR